MKWKSHSKTKKPQLIKKRFTTILFTSCCCFIGSWAGINPTINTIIQSNAMAVQTTSVPMVKVVEEVVQEEVVEASPKFNTITIELPTDELLHNKTYMDYRSITNRDTAQWKYIYSDTISVDDKGFLVTEDGYIGVALGTYFGPVGTKYIFTLDTGIELKVVKVEVKSDKHTCEHNYKAGSNDVIEFVIDTKAQYMQNNIWGNGLIFQGNFNNCEDFKGNIIRIQEVIE